MSVQAESDHRKRLDELRERAEDRSLYLKSAIEFGGPILFYPDDLVAIAGVLDDLLSFLEALEHVEIA